MRVTIRVTAKGLYIQACSCVSRRRLASKRAKHLREEAAEALRDAERSDADLEHKDAAEFRRMAAELRRTALLIAREARDRVPCVTCGDTGEVIGNGTYGGPAHRVHNIVAVI